MNILGGPDRPRNRDEDDDNIGSGDEDDNVHDEDINENEVRETETFLRDKLDAVSGIIKQDADKVLVNEKSSGLGDEYEAYSVAKDLVTGIEKLKLAVNQDDKDKTEIFAQGRSDKKDTTTLGQQKDTDRLHSKLDSDFSETNANDFDKAKSELKEEEFDDETVDELVNMSESNREFRPFRNKESLTHVNTHLQRTWDSDSVSRTSTQSSMDPRVIRERVKKQQKKKQEVLKARRIRKSGESALQTKLRRDTNQDIKQSCDDWF